MQDIGFDIISDLNLQPDDSFNWENKATSLYCILAGNVSYNLRTVLQVLVHLSTLYQGVFYIPGVLEYETAKTIPSRMQELSVICDNIPNVCLLHQHVAIIDGIAIIGANGWGSTDEQSNISLPIRTATRYEDELYLGSSLDKLQRHLDVKKIIVVTSAVPRSELYFGEIPKSEEDQIPICETLEADTENKVSHWVFGTYNKTVDTTIGNVNYVNNPYTKLSPYWAKRISILI